MTISRPYPVMGTVTYNGSAYRGAKIYAINISRKMNPGSIRDKNYMFSDASGHYMFDINNQVGSVGYTNGDKIRIYCEIGEIVEYSDTILNVTVGKSIVNFTITRGSGLSIGCKSTLDASGRFGLNDHLRGTIPACKRGTA